MGVEGGGWSKKEGGREGGKGGVTMCVCLSCLRDGREKERARKRNRENGHEKKRRSVEGQQQQLQQQTAAAAAVAAEAAEAAEANSYSNKGRAMTIRSRGNKREGDRDRDGEASSLHHQSVITSDKRRRATRRTGRKGRSEERGVIPPLQR